MSLEAMSLEVNRVGRIPENLASSLAQHCETLHGLAVLNRCEVRNIARLRKCFFGVYLYTPQLNGIHLAGAVYSPLTGRFDSGLLLSEYRGIGIW